ncbi:MAG: xylose isomerase [Armatimonadetes bacterium CG2_30_59_28]|nr:sugar phosphate isomerase/epimerase [Armatimonadota bacterium]OIO91324.1 MAG: xylose isomerase [Armatimonadetes bacterium CG2_30_59_28]PIU61759.1 MAG: xylose isomerase [Armatimonadetes bacterium CG07_land_8_20_14_0_80_59_28]PIX43621.1 MAG: xylose isomerase [Armatimonadetes bacterium CG_4_8_14_3_um_filter_58_9]PJB62227.1 MAG: xylose isomerase [Armatimonadetes bacterium CG_4_9_14_3_um_filter_58_7]
MRLGGPLFGDCSTPEKWIGEVRRKGYSAAFCPINAGQSEEDIQAFVRAAADANIVIAEVGAWSNPISPDEATRKEAMEKCKTQLALAEKVGARCCVNIAGSRGQKWDGPHPDNLSDETRDLIVESVREIIDTVNPTRTVYSLETMPWALPDSPDSYLRLIHAIDREGFGVHLDPANMINCPKRYYHSGDFLRECFQKLSPWIGSCHGKDILLHARLTLHLDEVRPGTGGLDYHVYLEELGKLSPDIPLMLEHLPSEEEYDRAADFLRLVAGEVGVRL